jgi:hypothetical protein
MTKDVVVFVASRDMQRNIAVWFSSVSGQGFISDTS